MAGYDHDLDAEPLDHPRVVRGPVALQDDLLVGLDQRGAVEALRRLDGAQRARSGVPTTGSGSPARSPVRGSTCLTVSASGSAGTTAGAPSRTAAITASTVSSGTSGPRGVVDQHGGDVLGYGGQAQPDGLLTGLPAGDDHHIGAAAGQRVGVQQPLDLVGAVRRGDHDHKGDGADPAIARTA